MRNHIHAPHDNTPAPALRPMAQFGGSLNERIARSTVAKAIYAKAHTVGKRPTSKPAAVECFIKL